MLGLDAASGAERWRHEPEDGRFGGIAVEGGRVWLVLENGWVLALDAHTGLPIARFSALELNLAGAGAWHRPARIGDTIIVPLGLVTLGLEAPR
ncbi:MAG: PQQ-binding-like beta-propeller repeat protein [Chloroflexi bacterium]|nr:PQQ-binding-like beta-propeller repeat protein [Chloroflexota bacterium]